MDLYTLAKKLYFPKLGGKKASEQQKAKAAALVKKAVETYNTVNGTDFKSGMDAKINSMPIITNLQLLINKFFNEEQQGEINDTKDKGS